MSPLLQRKYRSSLVERSGGISEVHILSLRGYLYFNTNPGSHFLLMEIDSIILAVYNQRYGSGDGGSLAVLLFMGGGDLLYTSYLGLPGWIPLGA